MAKTLKDFHMQRMMIFNCSSPEKPKVEDEIALDFKICRVLYNSKPTEGCNLLSFGRLDLKENDHRPDMQWLLLDKGGG
ncbi:hypothetical protein K7X08_031871 [Anisodus acutangulus]|uniref:Uncharacterized protein n=1 Tax=Anisodus acutangulus TaxID=402998 RepID=A0A9Q1RMJ3_9SOLA|nr:hypothetical protein K7X08_031871 [Anisodus acutangulus]